MQGARGPRDGARVERHLLARAVQRVHWNSGYFATLQQELIAAASCDGHLGQDPFAGTIWRYTIVRIRLAKNNSRNVMTTAWFTASPTPFGPPDGWSPLYAEITPAMTPNTAALISPLQMSGSCAKAENDEM